MQLNGVYYLDNILKTNRLEDAVMIEFPIIYQGSEFEFRVEYEGCPQEAKRPPWDGGFVWEKDVKGRPFISVACEGDGAGLWWPLKDHISDEPDRGAKMTFTVPEKLFCVSNGRLKTIETSDVPGKKNYVWEVLNPINNYNISVQLGYYVNIKDTLRRKGRIETLDYYVLDYHKEVAENHFSQSKKIIRFFEKYFGDYQWWEDGYKLVEVPYLGMEHQSAVTYGNGFSIYNGVRSSSWAMYGVIDPLIIHETGHEWFGNSVTASDPTHIWIHEGLQVYSEALYFEDKFKSYPVSIDYLKSIKGRIANKIPIVGNEDENHWALSGDTYMKGAWIMHTLRSVINDDSTWFEILKEFMVENAQSHVDTEDFFAKVKEKTGNDYSYFSEQYFYTPNQPELEYYQTDSEFYYKWSNVNENFVMPIDFLINGLEKRVFPSQEFQSFNISKHATIEVMDWKFYVKKKKNY